MGGVIPHCGWRYPLLWVRILGGAVRRGGAAAGGGDGRGAHPGGHCDRPHRAPRPPCGRLPGYGCVHAPGCVHALLAIRAAAATRTLYVCMPPAPSSDVSGQWSKPAVLNRCGACSDGGGGAWEAWSGEGPGDRLVNSEAVAIRRAAVLALLGEVNPPPSPHSLPLWLRVRQMIQAARGVAGFHGLG